MAKNNAKMVDISLLLAAGINPKTGLPIKISDNEKDADLYNKMRQVLNIVDVQEAINRYKWYNLPNGLDSQLIERVLYYRAQGAFFYMRENEKFHFLPYALDGTIDVYGRYKGITPLPFNGSTDDSENGEKKKPKPWVTGLIKYPALEPLLEDEVTIEAMETNCVLINDYALQIAQKNIPRIYLQQPIIDLEAKMLPYLRTGLLNSTGVEGMRVNNTDEESNVEAANRSIAHAALTGKRQIPIVGGIDFQELAHGTVAAAEEFLVSMQAIDNFRLSLLGIDNGGLFQKKSHMLQDEQETGDAGTQYHKMDGLSIRRHACDIINSIWPLGVWVEDTRPEKGEEQAIDNSESEGSEASEEGESDV